MALQLRAMTTLPEDPGLNFGTFMVTQLSVTPVPWDPVPFSGLCRHYMCMVHRHTCRQNTFTHKIK